MQNTIKIVAVLVVLALIAFGISLISRPKSDTTVVLGATLPLTGDLAFLGEGYRNGMNLALSELGDTKFKYKIVFEDDKFDPATGATTANKLISVDHADGLFSFGSPVGNVVSPLAQKNNIVHINGIASDQNVAKGDYNFVHWTPPYEESKLLISELQKRGISRVAIFVTNQPGALAVADQVSTDLKTSGIQLVGYETINPGETDMRSHVAKVAGSKPDMYILLSMSPELEILTKQIKEQGITTPLTSIESFEWTTQPQMFEGMWYINAADPSPAFVEKYKTAYGQSPTVGAANGYDAVMLFVHAVETSAQGTGKPSEEDIKNALLNVRDYSGAVGEHLSVDRDGLIVSKAVVRIIKDGKPVTVK
ncbi:MAG: ABC transporter substrate-binding protein [Patescibacteria group bacterium]